MVTLNFFKMLLLTKEKGAFRLPSLQDVLTNTP